jgi:hypothetical protein
MQMFNKNLKLLATMVGLVAVLVMGLAIRGVTQGYPGDVCGAGPVPCINRSAVVQGLQNAFAGLTASTEDLLDFEQAVFWSDGGPRQLAYIPPDPASGIWDRVRQLRAGENVEVPFGGLYIVEDATGLFPFKLPAVLKLRLRGDKVILINTGGDEVMAMPAVLDLTTPLPEKPGRVKFSVEVLGNKWCVRIKVVCVGEASAHGGS